MTENKLILFSPVDPIWGTGEDPNSHLVLVHPEIPANTGSIARLSACTGMVLHLVEPLGFKLEDRYLRRAGLDYWPNVTLCVHADWEAVEAIFSPDRLHLMTTHSERRYTEISDLPGRASVFGRETRGLEPEIQDRHPERLYRLPMVPNVRSLNLANACSVVAYDLRRRQGFPGMV